MVYNTFGQESVMTPLKKKTTTTQKPAIVPVQNSSFSLPGINNPVNSSVMSNPATATPAKPKIDPIGANIQANPTYKSPAQIMGMIPSSQPQPQSDPYNTVKTEAEKVKASNIATINQNYAEQNKLVEDQKSQKLSMLKSILEARKSDINNQILGARNKFQPQRENVDVRRAQDLQRAREILAAQGIQGGDNLTTQMGINTQASSNIAGIDQTQDDYVRNLEEESRQLTYANDAEQAQELSRAMELQRGLLSDKSTKISKAENDFVTKLATAYKNKQADEQKTKELKIEEDYKKGLLGNEEEKARNTAIKNKNDFITNLQSEETKRIAEQLKNMREGSTEFSKNTGYYDPYYGTEIPAEIANQLSKYSGNYAQAAQDLAQSNPELAQWAQVASIKKMMVNPALREQYGQQYKTVDAKKADAQIAKDNIDAMIKSVEFKYLEPKQQAELMDAQATLENKLITNQYLPDNLLSQINQRVASAQATLMNADTSRMNAETSRMSANDASARGWANINQNQSNLNSKQLEQTEKDLDNYIKDFYTSKSDDGSRIVVTTQDKTDIGAYLDGLATQGVPVSVIKSLRSKYNIGN